MTNGVTVLRVTKLMANAISRFTQASLCKLQGLLKDLPAVFKEYEIMKDF